MSTTKGSTGRASGGESNSGSDLPTLELPARAGAESVDASGRRIVARIPDYDDDKVKERWKKIIDRKREELETDVLQVTKPRAKLDQIAQAVLDILVVKLIHRDSSGKENAAIRTTTPEDLEKQVRAVIVEKGIASEVKKVTQRLNARRITDGRRWVLNTTYVYLLAKLFHEKANMPIKEFEELMADDLGVTEKILLDLEAEDGPLDLFTTLVVKSVMERNRISKSKTLLALVAQQVRSTI